jgi:alcohol dehydrogenase
LGNPLIGSVRAGRGGLAPWAGNNRTVSVAAVLTRPESIAIEDRPPGEPAPDEARIRVTAAGVCGTDIAVYSGSYVVPLPIVLGHEFVGVVEAVGCLGDEGLLGRRVTAEINNTCRSRRLLQQCRACARGMANHCLRRTVLGIIGADGAFAEHVIVPAANVHALPDSIADEAAVFIEPLAAAIQTFEMSAVRPGDTIVVLGAGRLGALIVAVASHPSPEPPTVIAVDTDPGRGERALRLGAREALRPDDKLADRVRALTQGLGADIVVEATGTPAGLDLAMRLVRPRGTIALKSTCGLPSDLDQTKVVVDEIRLQGSRCGPFDKAIRLLQEGNLDLSLFDIMTFPLSQTAAAIDAARSCDKVIVRP